MVAVITPVMAGMRSGGVSREVSREECSRLGQETHPFFFFFFQQILAGYLLWAKQNSASGCRCAVDAQNEPKEGGGRETSLFNYGHDKYLEQKVQDAMVVMELGDLTWSRNERFLGESDVGT